jgi:Outer membrane protein beta-barrel domain
MTKILSLSFPFALLSLVALSQTNTQTEKECRITSGIGFAGSANKTKSVGRDFWLQLDYKPSEHFSIATEFENMSYKQPGYYQDLPVTPNVINVRDNNFSLLIKYHFPIKSAVKIAVSSGWTYTTRQSDYYIIYISDSTSQGWFRDVSSFSDYRIPFLLEIECPVSKKINIQARAKYNLNPQNGDTYSSGIGLSLKL